MVTPWFLGIDPGQSGGIAAVSLSRPNSQALKMPDTPQALAQKLHEWLLDFGGPPVASALERVHSMPGQGVASMFKFGTNYGLVQGVLAALRIPYELVPPGTWQRALGCLSKGDKNVTKSRASALFPSLKVTHATADALLLAKYAEKKGGA